MVMDCSFLMHLGSWANGSSSALEMRRFCCFWQKPRSPRSFRLKRSGRTPHGRRGFLPCPRWWVLNFAGQHCCSCLAWHCWQDSVCALTRLRTHSLLIELQAAINFLASPKSRACSPCSRVSHLGWSLLSAAFQSAWLTPPLALQEPTTCPGSLLSPSSAFSSPACSVSSYSDASFPTLHWILPTLALRSATLNQFQCRQTAFHLLASREHWAT
mmetsp:Transcript_13719/g.26044  ORF Transcript_13719/g.26044 Transcript_13719/m.26044 type:complete len:214 (+) Transcript_13719:769-1410(+)